MSESTNNIQKNVELVFSYIYKNRIIIISICSLIIIVIAGILLYKSNIEKKDLKVNSDFENALTLYALYQNNQIPTENATSILVDITTRFQKSYSEAKGKKLKSRIAYSLGNIYFDVANYTEAKKYYKEVANYRGFYLQEPATYNLATTLIQMTNYSEALTTLESFVKAYPNSYLNPQATLSLSDVYRKQNDKTKALGVLRNWINNNTNSVEYIPIFNETITLIENNIY